MIARIALVVLIVSVAPLAALAQETPSGAAEMSDAEKLIQAQAKYDAAIEATDLDLMQEAVKLVGAILEKDPLNMQARLLAGEISMEINNWNSARDHFKAVLDTEPSNLRANIGYGKILNANRSYRQAVFYLETAERVSSDPEKSAEVKRLLAIAFLGRGDLTKAIEKVGEAVRMRPDDLDGLQVAVEIRLAASSRDPRLLEGEQGALPTAELYVNKIREKVRSNPGDKETLQKLSRGYELLLATLGELHNTYYKRNLHNQPTDELLPDKGVDAAAALHRIAQIRGEQALIALTLAEHDTLMFLEKAIEYDGRNLTYLESMLALCQRIKHREKAVETCRSILAINADHAGARQYLESVGEPLEAPTEE